MAEIAKLTPLQIEMASARLAKVMDKPCPVCSESHFLLFPTMLGEGFYDGKGEYLTSATLGPKIRVTCRNCGYILYFSAETFGLLESKDDSHG